jgi:hypothetical protein
MKKRRHLTIMLLWGILLALVVIVFRDRLFPGEGETPANPAPTQSVTPAPEAPVVEKQGIPKQASLVGRWRRSDGGYILDIQAIRPDGTLEAKYLNPRPIHISKAQLIKQAGHQIVIVQFQDRGYPGSLYTLTYDPKTDQLEGVYHHRGINKKFNVKFARLPTVKTSSE